MDVPMSLWGSGLVSNYTREKNLRPYSDNSWKKKIDPFSGNKRKNIMKYIHIVIIVDLFIFCLHQVFTLEYT